MTTHHTSGAADLPEALAEYLEAQDALDNREYAGINAEPHEKLVRSRNHARAALEAALAGQAVAPATRPATATETADVKYALAHADTAADLLMRAHQQAPETWRGWYDDALVHIDIARKALSAIATRPAPPAMDGGEDAERLLRQILAASQDGDSDTHLSAHFVSRIETITKPGGES